MIGRITTMRVYDEKAVEKALQRFGSIFDITNTAAEKPKKSIEIITFSII